MKMRFEELDDRTRHFMAAEFEAEERSDAAYRGERLSPSGSQAFPALMCDAIRVGDEITLIRALQRGGYWRSWECYTRDGITRTRTINLVQASEQLGLSEFNTWYVRGLARRLLEEGVEECEVYRGALPKWEPGECSAHEGMVLPVRVVFDGHRVRYWPPPGNLGRFSIPFTPGCHHTIRRVKRLRVAV